MDMEENRPLTYVVSVTDFPRNIMSRPMMKSIIKCLEKPIAADNMELQIIFTIHSGYFTVEFDNQSSIDWFLEALEVNQIQDIIFKPLSQIRRIPPLTVFIPNMTRHDVYRAIRQLGRDNDGFNASKLRFQVNEENDEGVLVKINVEANEYSYIAQRNFTLIINGLDTQLVELNQE